MLNERMEAVRATVQSVIQKVFPEDYLDYVFSDKITIEDLCVQIMMECAKYAYDNSSPKHSLRYHLRKAGLSEDDGRAMVQRSLKKINRYREEEYYYRKRENGIELAGLLPKRMDSIEEKLDGYAFNDFQFWEILNVHDMKLVDAIVENRFSAKNFKHSMFCDDAEEYDRIITKMLSLPEDAEDYDLLFSSLALFILEWKYNFDFYYELACEKENQKVLQVPDLARRCSLFCGPVGLTSRLVISHPMIVPGPIHTDSRLLLLRKKYVHEFICAGEEKFGLIELQYSEALVIIATVLTRMTFQGEIIREWFVNHTAMEDWASIAQEYNVTQCFVRGKEWTKKRINFVKEIYRATHTETKNPEIRP